MNKKAADTAPKHRIESHARDKTSAKQYTSLLIERHSRTLPLPAMPTAALDKQEFQYLSACRRPRLAWQRTFFLCFLPAMAGASMATQWTRGLDEAGTLLTGAVFLTLSLIYLPMAYMTSRQYCADVVAWSGTARVVPAAKGKGHENYVDETEVMLPAAWETRFMALRGRTLAVRGVAEKVVGTDAAPRVHALDIGGDLSVSREVPLGLAAIDIPEFYVGLALVPVGALVLLALKTRFHLEFFLYFGLISAVLVLYGLRVTRNNAAIQRTIDATREPLSEHPATRSDALRQRG